eukprot:TRINITY_DN20713_c0_g2_i1.p1 TRINITY_DN20713_c0_g2~~TRINITY_DN20713_c0_g2_i1.p1  ORF type:complete len:131 (+),score=8.45 TRINITY_DN20713_c0_g2_i1:42-434(+)
MSSLVRSTTLAFNRRFDYYQVLDQSKRDARKTVNKSKGEHVRSFGSRLERAKKRQIFLRSYKLTLKTRDESIPLKFKKTMIRVKTAVFSFFAFVGLKSLTSLRLCGPPALCGASQRSVRSVPARSFGRST